MTVGRKTTPCGTPPVVTKRHSTMSSLRASATTMVLRLLPAATLGLIPLCQGTVLLVDQKTPGELDHAATHACVARLGEPFLSSAPAALVG